MNGTSLAPPQHHRKPNDSSVALRQDHPHHQVQGIAVTSVLQSDKFQGVSMPSPPTPRVTRCSITQSSLKTFATNLLYHGERIREILSPWYSMARVPNCTLIGILLGGDAQMTGKSEGCWQPWGRLVPFWDWSLCTQSDSGCMIIWGRPGTCRVLLFHLWAQNLDL